MSRPHSNKVDFFPHPVHKGKKMNYLMQRHGHEGYSIWYQLLEQMGDADNHYLNLSDETDIMMLTTELMTTETKLMQVITDLIRINVFNYELWTKKRVIWSEKFINSIQVVYNRRKSKCMNLQSLLRHLPDYCQQETPLITRDVDKNPHSIVEYSRAEDKKKKTSKKEKLNKDSNRFTKAFEMAREIFRGTKNGFLVEYENFCRHDDHNAAVFKLRDAVQERINWAEKRKQFGYDEEPWPHFKTWINQRRWEATLEELHQKTERNSPYDETARLYLESRSEEVPGENPQGPLPEDRDIGAPPPDTEPAPSHGGGLDGEAPGNPDQRVEPSIFSSFPDQGEIGTAF